MMVQARVILLSMAVLRAPFPLLSKLIVIDVAVGRNNAAVKVPASVCHMCIAAE